MPTNPEDTNDIKDLEIPESLRKMLMPDEDPTKMIGIEEPKGYCSVHGRIAWARMALYDHDPTSSKQPELISEHCVYCLSRIFTALVGRIKYDDPAPGPDDSKK